MLGTIDYYPAVVGSAMCGTMHVMNAGDELSVRGKEGLSIGEDGDMSRRGDSAVEIVIDHDFDQPHIAAGHGDTQGKDFMIAVRASMLCARRANGYSADHDIVDGAALAGVDKAGELLIDLRRAGSGDWDVALRSSGENGTAKRDS